MKTHFINFCSGACMGWICLQVNQFSSTASTIEVAVKAVISLVVGLVSALLTNVISKWFKDNNPGNPTPTATS